MIAAHARFGSGADTRADWAEANAKTASDSGSAADDADDEESGDAPIDPADYTGRSPHPVIHLLRQCDIDAADEAWYEQGPGDDIRAKNAALLRGMGESRLRSMLARASKPAEMKRRKTRDFEEKGRASTRVIFHSHETVGYAARSGSWKKEKSAPPLAFIFAWLGWSACRRRR